MKRLLIVVLASLLVLSGCFSSSKKPVNNRVAAQVEEEFKQRWIAERMANLARSNPEMEPREVRRLAVQEFRDKFKHTDAAKRADPMGDGYLP